MISRDNVQGIYPLLQKQRALAFYSLQNEQADPGFIQLRFVIKGPIHQETFTAAWQSLVTRHESMRVSLQSPQNKPAMLVVLKSCEIPVEWVDKRAENHNAQQQYINDRLNRLRENGLELSAAPVHRLLGVQTHDNTVEFFWTCHHLFLDGWSAVVLLNDLAQLYSHERCGTVINLPAKSTQADYLKWFSSQREVAAKEFWSQQFVDFEEPVLIAEQFGDLKQKLTASSNNHNLHLVHADTSLTTKIEELAAELKVTHATIVYVAWAIYVAAISDQSDIAFGTTSAGRSFDLPDSQLMTGYFANVIAKRFRLQRSQRLADFITQSHRGGFAALQFEHVPIDNVQSYAGISRNKALFDHLVLFENLPQSDITLQDPDGEISLGTFSGDLTSMYPLTLTIQPDEQWRFKYLYADHLKDSELLSVFDGFPAFLSHICSQSTQSIGQILDWASNALDRTTQKPSNEAIAPAPGMASTQLARNKTELAVAAIWEDLLGISEIDVNTEFMALGGRSMAAVHMLSLIEDKLGTKLTMLDLVTQPTVAGLASRIDSTARESNWRSLIPLKPGGSKPPVIFVHAVGSHALFLRAVTKYFDKDQPVIGLQLVGLDGECKPMNSIDLIAQHYLEEIQSYQPDGPYFFVAHCAGAMVAHELIQRLKKQGKEVSLFVVIDAQPPFSKPFESNSEKIKSRLSKSRNTSVTKHYWEIFKHGSRYSRYRLSIYADRLFEQFKLIFGSTMIKKQVHLARAHRASSFAMNSYIGKPIDQKVVLIRCENELRAHHMGWKDMSSELDVLVLPIGHETMFTEPEAATLGKNLSRIVKKAPKQHQIN